MYDEPNLAITLTLKGPKTQQTTTATNNNKQQQQQPQPQQSARSLPRTGPQERAAARAWDRPSKMDGVPSFRCCGGSVWNPPGCVVGAFGVTPLTAQQEKGLPVRSLARSFVAVAAAPEAGGRQRQGTMPDNKKQSSERATTGQVRSGPVRTFNFAPFEER
jgi:hypothetical protein